MKKIELLAPAGNMECLKTAVYFGADAIYMSGKSYGLRAFADNFDGEQMHQAVQYAHRYGKKVYITVNAVFRNQDLKGLEKYAQELESCGVDAVIVADPGVMQIIQKTVPKMEIHLSTQANTTNYASANFWHGQGVKRIVLSREVTLEEIREIRDKTPDTLDLEAFVHGAMCISYSGRCLLSSVTTGRSGNRGECAQPCRWKYYLHEKSYEGEYFPIYADDQGTYVLNSKDLMMIEHIDALYEAGITSFKIEGRMKSPYYVACVVDSYRRAIDAYEADPKGYVFDRTLLKDLEKCSTRQFTTGFYFGNPREEAQDVKRDALLNKHNFVAVVRAKAAEPGHLVVEQRNKFSVGDELEVLSPHMGKESFSVESIVNEQGENQESAPHPQQIVTINCPYPLEEMDIIRKK